MVCEQREVLLTSFCEQTRVYSLIVGAMQVDLSATEYQAQFHCALAMMESCRDAQRQLSSHILTHGCLGDQIRNEIYQSATVESLPAILRSIDRATAR